MGAQGRGAPGGLEGGFTRCGLTLVAVHLQPCLWTLGFGSGSPFSTKGCLHLMFLWERLGQGKQELGFFLRKPEW